MALDASPNDSTTHGDSADPARLEPLMREALIRVIAVERDRRRGIGDDLRILLTDLCRQAHTDGISAERLIILLKRRWATVNESEHLSRPQAQDAMNLLVTACIEAYFEEP